MNTAQRFVYWLDKWTNLFRYSQRKRADWFKHKFKVRDLIEGSERILDIGCGTGAITCVMAAIPNRVVIGLDVSDYLIEEHRNSDQFKFVQSDAHKLPFDDGSFDCVTVFWVLHHVDKPDQVIGEALRVLSHSGKLIIVEDILSNQTRFDRTLVRLYDSLLNLELRHDEHENRSLEDWKQMVLAEGNLIDVQTKLLRSYCCMPFLKFGLLVAQKN